MVASMSGTLKFASGFTVPVEVPSVDLKAANKTTKEIRAVLVLEQALTPTRTQTRTAVRQTQTRTAVKQTKVVKNWHQKAVASQTKQTVRRATTPQAASKSKKIEILSARTTKTTASVDVTEFVKRSQSSYQAPAKSVVTPLKAVKRRAGAKLERVSPLTFTRHTPAGRGSTKEIRDSKGNIYASAQLAAEAYGLCRWQVYWAIANRNGRVSSNLVLSYTGRLASRWQYYSRATGKTYRNIFSAAKAENLSQGKIFSNLKQPEDQLNWEVVAVKQ